VAREPRQSEPGLWRGDGQEKVMGPIEGVPFAEAGGWPGDVRSGQRPGGVGDFGRSSSMPLR
jgi:hypothetical protein